MSCYICEKQATIRLGYARHEATMCKNCDNFIGDNFDIFFDLELDSRECNPLSLLKYAPDDKKDIVLHKLKILISYPEYTEFRKAECTKNLLFPHHSFRIVEKDENDENDILNRFHVIHKDKARLLETHTPCNVCGIRFFNNNEIIKNAIKGNFHYEPKLKCLLCQNKEELIRGIKMTIKS